MNSSTWSSAAVVSALFSVACFSGEGSRETEIPRDTTDETDTDTDTDADTDTDTDTDTYTVATIEELQQGLVPQGSSVRIEQAVVVGAQLPGGFHLADPEGGTTYAGIWLSGSSDDDTVIEGDVLSVTGVLQELEEDTVSEAGDGTVTAVVMDQPWKLQDLGEVPAPVTVDIADLAEPDSAEPYEGMLIRIDDVTVSDGGDGTWQAGGVLPVGDLYHSSSTLTGATLDAVVGVLWYEQGRFVLVPRSEEDLQGYDALLDDCGTASCVKELSAGALVITEIMVDPEAVFDDLGEWFEVFVPGDVAVDLRGLEVSDDDGESFTVTESVVIEAGTHAVLAANQDATTNGGVTASWDYPYASVSLANGSDELVLAHSDVIFDRVAWDDGVTFPDQAGASMALDPEHLDTDGNDDGASWCAASDSYGDGDLGSPGSANSPCFE